MAPPAEVLARVVFSAGGQDYRWSDVVTAARVWSRWAELGRATAGGIAAVRRLNPPITQAALEDAEHAFRYARSLLAADEMQAWLANWGLAMEDWLAYLRRQIAGAGGDPGDSPPDRGGWAGAVCSGGRAALARGLAERAGAAGAWGG